MVILFVEILQRKLASFYVLNPKAHIKMKKKKTNNKVVCAPIA